MVYYHELIVLPNITEQRLYYLIFRFNYLAARNQGNRYSYIDMATIELANAGHERGDRLQYSSLDHVTPSFGSGMNIL